MAKARTLVGLDVHARAPLGLGHVGLGVDRGLGLGLTGLLTRRPDQAAAVGKAIIDTTDYVMFTGSTRTGRLATTSSQLERAPGRLA